jgi:Bacterial archaeo-eukaryotic release factor family 10
MHVMDRSRAVITRADIDNLRAMRAPRSAVLSLYLSIPVDLAEHRGLAARVRELLKSAAVAPCGAPLVSEADLDAVVKLVSERSHDWLGHSVAIFASARVGLLKAIPLPGQAPEQAMVDDRPQVRPLLAAIQRNPGYRVALVDVQHAWVLAITADGIETVAERMGQQVRKTGFAGWYGLEAYRIQQRVLELSRQHFKDTTSMLEQTELAERGPLVIGGHDSEIRQFLALLPRSVADQVAGTINVDLRSVTPGRLRELANPVIADWTSKAQERAVRDLLGQPPGVAAVTGVGGCAAASQARAIAELVLPDGEPLPGYACGECGALTVADAGCDCQDPDEHCRAVPDVLEEMACRTLDSGGSVTAVREAPFTAGARLRFPLPAAAQGGSRLP